ncbi:MAG: hypothetical protein K8T10_05760 [Candidatus Eremiobacteraeota bacterium]|nr:hypothetical protein [Candidatus Eremiobacteraeota bacterium]
MKENQEKTKENGQEKRVTRAMVIIIVVLLVGALVKFAVLFMNRRYNNPDKVAGDFVYNLVKGNKKELAKLSMPHLREQVEKIEPLEGLDKFKKEDLPTPMVIQGQKSYKAVYYIQGKYEYQVGVILKKIRNMWLVDDLILIKKPRGMLKPFKR